MKRFPTFSQWKQIFKVLDKKEKKILASLFIIAGCSFVFLIASIYINSTQSAPALGGNYTEGVVGQPRFINPIYGETNDIDRTLIDIVFSGLMSYDAKGHIVNDLAEKYTASADGKTYQFTIKEHIFWHDGRPLTADDVLFTIKTIQNSDYKSPLRANWIDVEAVKISERSIQFKLKSPYNGFLENATVKIIPKHIWENIPSENFALSSYNIQPIGSGPFQFARISQTETGFIKTMRFSSNRKYYQHPSFIATLLFQFFENKDDLVKAAKSGAIDGFSLTSFDSNHSDIKEDITKQLASRKDFSLYSFSLPRYVAVFFNTQKNSLFSDPNLRKSFSHAVDKQSLVFNISSPDGNAVAAANSPIVADFFGYQDPSEGYPFDLQKAKTLLDKSGFKETGNSIRGKIITKKPAFQFTSYLKIGSKGNEVTQLQGCLTTLASGKFTELLREEKSGTYGKLTENAVTEFQKTYLPAEKVTGETGPATRKKLNELCIGPSQNSQPLAFTLLTANQPQLIETANLLKEYWHALGAQVTVNAVPAGDLRVMIKSRSYDALLYGEAFGAELDLYPFWHSSQKFDPGLNLSSYENKEVDQLLKDSRETQDPLIKKQKLEKLQNIIIADAPALFLYNPDYLYWSSKKIKGIGAEIIIDPAKRFSGITQWYLKTRRVWK